MNERWQMNRMGLLNFWYFDDQEFDFANGKLLIRGQNGSGKSISTQSFIPFILDGNKAPYRLDPFGSKDRRMEYYFLLDGQKDESAGYIWLEFKKPRSEQYRTLVIGQRARKNSDMQFWSGIILDNRRINRDFQLKKPVGDSYALLSKQEFKNKLGESNFYSERASEYKAAVNRHIFGFDQLDQYDQFVDLLIKVRAPKLSKEFKPTKIYEIYNESLQVLGDSDILPMVESMEEIERTQQKLEEFKDTKKALDNVGRVYNLYNRYFLCKKAQNYQRYQGEYSQIASLVETRVSQFEANQVEIGAIDRNSQDLKRSSELLQTERASLPLEDIEAKLASYKQAKADEGDKRNQLENVQESLDMALVEKDVKVTKRRQEEKAAADSQYHLEKILGELDEINETALLADHKKIAELDEVAGLGSLCDELEAQVHQVGKQVDQVLRCLDESHNIQVRLDESNQSLGLINEQINDLNIHLDDQFRLIENTKDELINRFYRFEQSAPALDITSLLTPLANIIREYQGYGDFKKIDRILSDQKNDQILGVNKEIVATRFALANSQKEKDLLNQELISLIQAPDLTYPHSEAIALGRKVLSDNQIPFISVYQALEFSDALSSEQRNILEAQLIGTNLIDALIVNYGNCDRARQLLGGHDQILVALKPTTGPGHHFEAGPHPEFAKEITDFIALLCDEGTFNLDGHYNHGLVEGFASANEPSVFVGRESRRINRQKQIGALETKIAAIEELRDEDNRKIIECEEKLARLESDYQSLQVFDQLDDELEKANGLETKLNQLTKEQQAVANNIDQLKIKLAKIENETLQIAKTLPYPLHPARYQEAKDSLGEYGMVLNQVHRETFNYQAKMVAVAATGEVIEKISEQIDGYYQTSRQLESQLDKINTIIATIDTYLNQESTRQLHQRVRAIDDQLASNEVQLASLNEQRQSYREQNLLLERDIAQGQSEVAIKRKLSDLAKELFVQERDLGYVKLDQGTLVGEVQKASALLQQSEAQKTVGELQQALSEVQRNNFSALTNYGISSGVVFKDNEEQLLGQRIVITLKYQGRQVDYFEFYDSIAQIIENTQLLIVEKDKELFEKFFSDALANKLVRKINDAKSWVRDMSELMENLKTTSAISFSLAWKPKAALSSDDLATLDLVRLLESDREILSYENLSALSAHFSKRIKMAKQDALENGLPELNYGDLVRQALDYREWFEFRLYYRRLDGMKKELTNSAFNVLSGGEKAMAMYVPLFTAVNAQYQKSRKPDFPRIIALDEAFAGVDNENISSMFDLVEKLDFDFIMNSQVLWGTDGAVKELAISELYRPLNSQVVSTINYHWNGKVKTLI